MDECFMCLRAPGIACGCEYAGRNPVHTVRLWFDGGSRGNPGQAAGGAYIKWPAELHRSDVVLAARMGLGTSNEAEFFGARLGLQELARTVLQTPFEDLFIFGDNRMVLSSLQAEAPHPHRLQQLHQACLGAISFIRSARRLRIVFAHVPREGNARADAAVNAVLDSQIPAFKEVRHVVG